MVLLIVMFVPRGAMPLMLPPAVLPLPSAFILVMVPLGLMVITRAFQRASVTPD
jgi:hypothetical protein